MFKLFVSKRFFDKISFFPILTKIMFVDPLSKGSRGLAFGTVSRRTHRNRLSEIDFVLLDELGVGVGQSNFVDIGCSTGITTLDTYMFCKYQGINLDLYLNDPYSRVIVHKRWFAKKFSLLSGKTVYFKFLGLFAGYESRSLFISKIIFKLLERVSRWNYYSELNFFDDEVNFKLTKGELMIYDGDFFSEMECSKKFHVIRVANVIRDGLFDNDALKYFVRNTFAHLEEGGILIECRGDESGVGYAIYMKKGSSLFLKRISDKFKSQLYETTVNNLFAQK